MEAVTRIPRQTPAERRFDDARVPAQDHSMLVFVDPGWPGGIDDGQQVDEHVAVPRPGAATVSAREPVRESRRKSADGVGWQRGD